MEAAKLIEIGKFNKWAHDRTQWFHVPQPNLDDAEKDLIMFDVKVAVAHGLPEAVLITNLRYFLHQKLKKMKGPYEHEMSPTTLATLLPFFSKQTIKRALTTLKKAGLIIKVSKTKPIYTLPTTDEDIGSFLVGMSPKLVDEVQNETGKVQNET
jgi:Fe2+ or Zn2+ uptake regulation protein